MTPFGRKLRALRAEIAEDKLRQAKADPVEDRPWQP